MLIKGRCKKDKRTKNLISRLLPGEIALVDHLDLDEIAAEALIEKQIKALINIAPSLSGRFPAGGTKKLLNAGIPVIDQMDPKLMIDLKEGAEIIIKDNQVYYLEKLYLGNLVKLREFLNKLDEAELSLMDELEKFTLNTLKFAQKEMNLIFAPLEMPKLKDEIKNKHVLVVVRGKNYRQDLFAIKSYIKEIKPVLIGVDGGADALLEYGLLPNIIIGDMDSVSDQALLTGADIIVHSYLDGRSPGENRIRKLNIPYQILPAPGTSEDVAMLLAYQAGAELIVALGTHTNLLDDLNKGREGMASTFLTRLKIGSILIDAKGVSKLYKQRLKTRYFFQLIGAALLPLITIFFVQININQILRLLWIRLQFAFGF